MRVPSASPPYRKTASPTNFGPRPLLRSSLKAFLRLVLESLQAADARVVGSHVPARPPFVPSVAPGRLVVAYVNVTASHRADTDIPVIAVRVRPCPLGMHLYTSYPPPELSSLLSVCI